MAKELKGKKYFKIKNFSKDLKIMIRKEISFKVVCIFIINKYA